MTLYSKVCILFIFSIKTLFQTRNHKTNATGQQVTGNILTYKPCS